jgi:beta-glucosidase
MRRTRLLIAAGAAVALAAAVTAGALVLRPDPDPDRSAYQDPARPVPERVDDLLARMSLADKIGQMTLVDRGALASPADLTSYRIGAVLSGGGSAPPQNRPEAWADMYDEFQAAALATPLAIPMIYGIDAVHGHNNVAGATLFPHNIGLGATRDPELVAEIGRATAVEVTGTGIDWNFAPCLCVARDQRWGRTYESYGEDPALVAELGGAYITGLQGESLADPTSVLATAKHYLGDGGTTGGVDQGDTALSEAELREIHLPPYAEAVRRGVGAVMVSFSSWNGDKLHGHEYLITELLKGELGFEGFVVSDWAGIDQLDGQEGFTAGEVATAVNAGIDLVMVPFEYPQFTELLRGEVAAGRVPLARIDDANRRILTRKFQLGLFERPYADRAGTGTAGAAGATGTTGTIGSEPHRALARRAVARSQVLLKNDGDLLPLPAGTGRIFVAGRSADDVGNQSGGWTISWQGGSGPVAGGTSILAGIRQAVSGSATVDYDRDGAGIDGSYDVAIAVIGETPYAEFEGDRPDGVFLDQADLATLDRLRAAGVPLVVVLVTGRPLDIAGQLPGWDALLVAWLPGTEGGGVADVLFGSEAPSGTLPVTWPASPGQLPIHADDGQQPLFRDGAGLGYDG